jgi:hypothetical protein
MRTFEYTACADWSGARGERPPGLAVATMQRGHAPKLERAGFKWSRQDILDWLIMLADKQADIIIGLDLSFGFPFFDKQSYFPEWQESPLTARELWAAIDTACASDLHLGADTFLNHAEVRRHFRHSKDDIGDLFTGGIGRLRAVEHHQRITGQANSWSCFNLVGAGQVGKSSLTGMRVLHRLHGRIPIWPFDPVPAQGPVIVEIYTSMAARAAGLPKGRSKVRDRAGLIAALSALGSPCPARLHRYDDHATDALITAAWLQTVTHDRALWDAPMKAPWNGEYQKTQITETEGWTFGVI